MKAMVFAAGLGTRLQPFTNHTPKALVTVAGKPMLYHTINYLINNGIDEVIINVHHYAEQIIEYLITNNNFGIDIQISDETEMLLDTGGGLSKASWFFDDAKPFLVLNVDVLTDISIAHFLTYHNQHKPIATLAVSNRETTRKFIFNSQNELCGWLDHKTNREIIGKPVLGIRKELSFSGLHIIDPTIFSFLAKNQKFSIVDTYLAISAQHKVAAFEHDSRFWVDMGKPDALLKATELLQQSKNKE